VVDGTRAHAAWRPTELGDGVAMMVAPPRDLEAEARAEREREVADAFTRGFEEGRNEGEMGEQARLRAAVASCVEAIDVLRAGEERWAGTIEENLCALATAIARHVIEREVALDPELVPRLVRRALTEFPIDQPVRVRVHPNDLGLLQAHADESGAITNGREAHWIPDVRITPGGCVVEGRDRIIDGRVDTQLERVYRRLTYSNA
jgi:flagellar biosynthesis/type III secretory pathway protein FliH